MVSEGLTRHSQTRSTSKHAMVKKQSPPALASMGVKQQVGWSVELDHYRQKYLQLMEVVGLVDKDFAERKLQQCKRRFFQFLLLRNLHVLLERRVTSNQKLVQLCLQLERNLQQCLVEQSFKGVLFQLT